MPSNFTRRRTISNPGTDLSSLSTIANSVGLSVQDTQFSVQDDGDATKLLKFQNSGITTATTRTWTVQDKNITVAGIDDVYSYFRIQGSSFSPVDAATYYFGPNAISPTSTASSHSWQFGFSGTIIGTVISASNNTVSGSTENVTYNISNITTSVTSTLTTTAKTNGSTSIAIVQTVTGLSIPFTSTDNMAIQMICPTWATNPTTVAIIINLIIKRS